MGPMDARWRFHTLVVASGQTAVETSSRNELLATIAADAELTAPSLRPQGGASFRIVRRQEIDETVRAMPVEEVRAERQAERATAAEARAAALAADDGQGQSQEAAVSASAELVQTPAVAEDDEIDVGDVPRTPTAMALAFQRLVARDKHSVLHSHARDESTETDAGQMSGGGVDSAARIFLLVDYPSTIAEVHALLCTGEVGESRPHQSSPHIPLLPLVDGVLLVVDPMRELRERRKSVSQSDERRRSITRRVSNDANDSALLDKQQAPISVFQSANPFVRDLYDAAAVGSLEWSDFVFVDLPCSISTSEVKPAAELKSDFLAKMDPLMAQKAAFKDWVATVETTPLPRWDGAGEDATQLEREYRDLLRPVFEPSVSIGAVVFAMREAVVRVHRDSSPLSERENNESVPEPFIVHGDHVALRLARSYDLFTKRDLVPQGDPCRIAGQRIDDVDKAIWRTSDLPGVGNCGRKAMPVLPRLSDAERSVLDTEFACFATIPIPRVHLTRQLLRLEELIGQQWKGKLRVRDVAQDLQASVLPQRLAAILRENPSVLKEYDEPTDSLLLAAITATAPGRFRTTSWTARDHVRHRPALKDWQKELLPSEEYLTPRTALAATACVALSSGELGAVAEKCSIAYPADQSLIRLFQTPHAPAWLSVSLDGDVFGLRPQPKTSRDAATARRFAMQFYASLQDGSQLSIVEGRARPKKPDGHGSVTVSHTSAEGLIVTACSDGTIILQQHRATAPANEDASSIENYRVISGKGAIVCVMMDESRRILLPNGDVVVRRPGSTDAAEDSVEAAARELVVDPETNALVERRSSTGVVVVTHTDGSRITYHADGTLIHATATRSHVLISKCGLADVCIDVDVNLAAQRHSDGEKVAVTKGGLRTRSVVRTRDGTEVHVQYNTKVVAEVNGRIVVHKPDSTKIVAKDSGRVEFTSHLTAAEASNGGRDDSDDADRDELSHNRVYYFNCREGSLSLCDHEQNLFKVDVGDGRGLPSVNVALAGVLSESDVEKYGVEPIPAKAVVNDPIAPYLFILRGDGTGLELLRPRDVAAFWNQHQRGSADRTEISQAMPPPPLVSATMPSPTEWWAKTSQWAVDRTFLQEVRPDPSQKEIRERLWFQDEKVTACFERLRTPVATAFFMLEDCCLPRLSIPENQFTVVRRIQQLRPMTSEDVSEMLQTLDKWRQWQDVRETNKDRFKVTDPRNADVLAQEAAMQRKVIAAYKATRARKKAERQKLREMQRKASVDSKNGVAKMETVQEGDEPQDAQGDEDDEFDQLISEGSDDGSQSDGGVEIDDPDELMWTAFSEADMDATGRLTIQQARQALVQVLGTGVTTSELSAKLVAFRQPEPYAIPFDVFADLVEAFKESASLSTDRAHGDGEMASPRGNQSQSNDAFAFQHKQLAAGSATEAVRSFSLLRLKGD